MHIRFPGQQRERLPVAHLDRELFVGQARRIHAHPVRIVEQQRLQLGLGQGEDVGNIEAVDRAGLHAHRAHQHEPAHELRRLGGEFAGDPSAERTADHIDLVEVEAIQQLQVDVGDVVRCLDPVGQGRLTETGMRRGDQPVPGGQQWYIGMGWRKTLRAVKEQYRWPVASLEHFKLDVGNGHGLSLQRGVLQKCFVITLAALACLVTPAAECGHEQASAFHRGW